MLISSRPIRCIASAHEIRKLVKSASTVAPTAEAIGPLIATSRGGDDQAARASADHSAHAVAETGPRLVDPVRCIEHFYGVGDASLTVSRTFRRSRTWRTDSCFGCAGGFRDPQNPKPLAHGAKASRSRRCRPTRRIASHQESESALGIGLPHPSLEDYAPSMTRHGACGFRTTQEVRWKKNYQVWMAAVRSSASRAASSAPATRISLRLALRLRDHARARRAGPTRSR